MMNNGEAMTGKVIVEKMAGSLDMDGTLCNSMK
jgi:hypothetical protein